MVSGLGFEVNRWKGGNVRSGGYAEWCSGTVMFSLDGMVVMNGQFCVQRWSVL